MFQFYSLKPICSSADKWIYTKEYYSAIKRNTFESVLMKWMNLEPIIQSEVSQKGKTNPVYQCLNMEFRQYDDPTCGAAREPQVNCSILKHSRQSAIKRGAPVLPFTSAHKMKHLGINLTTCA